jgi:hypothetical protein
MDDPWLRGLLIVGLGSCGVGLSGLVNGPGMWRLSGLGLLVFGSVLITSLVLRYQRPGLNDPRWSSSRHRRYARFVLAHAWRVVSAVMIAGVAVVVADKIV